jgi:starvation-inducible DNA-binding protein
MVIGDERAFADDFQWPRQEAQSARARRKWLEASGNGEVFLWKKFATKQNPIGRATEIQSYGTVANRPISLDHKVRLAGASNLNQILSDTMTLRDMNKKHHWQVSGSAFYQLHLLFDKHYAQQAEIVDMLADAFKPLAALPSQWRTMSPRPLVLPVRHGAGKTPPFSCSGCCRLTNSSLARPVSRLIWLPKMATTEPTTCWFLTFFV